MVYSNTVLNYVYLCDLENETRKRVGGREGRRGRDNNKAVMGFVVSGSFPKLP